MFQYILHWEYTFFWMQYPNNTKTAAYWKYHKTSNISRTLVGNKIVDNSDVVGTLPVGAAPTTSSFSI